MQHINLTVINEQNLPFLMELLRKFDFVSDIKIENSIDTFSDENSNEDENFEQHLSALKEKYAHLPISWATEKPKIADFTNILTDRKLSLTEIREKAWKRK